jgi:ribonuclease J
MTFSVLALGGLGEMGKNCLAIRKNGSIIVIDCGVKFSNRREGVDVIFANWSVLAEHRSEVCALIITHTHEDHIGAVPYFLSEFDVPVFGPPYAIAMIQARLSEHPPMNRQLIATTSRFTPSRQFEVEPIAMSHSTTDSYALAITTSDGVIVHTGDFKLDPDGVGDTRRLAEIGESGVQLLLSDSTGADSNQPMRSESEVAQTLETLIEGWNRRVFVALFASNTERLGALIAIATRARRKIVVLGRSLQKHLEVAEKQGCLHIPSGLLIAPEDTVRYAPHEVLVITTGTQAEPRSALFRLAAGESTHLRVGAGDRVILSARAVPGNDVAVMDMLACFYRLGCDVRTLSTDPSVHASGHAMRGELEELIAMLNPRFFVPIHGTRHHLERHAQLARSLGVPSVLVIEDGQSIDVSPQLGLTRGEVFDARPVHVWNRIEVDHSVLLERRRLAEFGVVSALAFVDSDGRPTNQMPLIEAHGVNRDPEILRKIVNELHMSLSDHPWIARPTIDELERLVIAEIRRLVGRELGFRPVVIAFVQTVSRTKISSVT